MSRLAAEFERLYAAGPDGSPRALVLDVGRPSDWELLGAVWRGVQLDLSLPAPGIAIAGENSYQLWFSLERGVLPDEAGAFFEGLRSRWLAGIAAPRIRCLTSPPEVPSEVREGQWSAFVAPDLAPVFVEATWLDIPPGAEGQADLLRGLKSIDPLTWATALGQLTTSGGSDDASTDASSRSPSSRAGSAGSTAAATPAAAALFSPATQFTDPRAFLLHVMNDPSVPMPSRIEAAKALLQAPAPPAPHP